MDNNKLKPFWKIASYDELLGLIVTFLAIELDGGLGYLTIVDEIEEAIRDSTICITPHYFPDGHLITVSWKKNEYPDLQENNKFKVTFYGLTSREA